VALEVTFGNDRFAIADQNELPTLMKGHPGRLLQVHHYTRSSWCLFFADKQGVIHCGFRKSTSSTFHFFAMPDLQEAPTFRDHILKLSFKSTLRFRRKSRAQTKGSGGKKNGVCIYLGKDYPTVAYRVKCAMIDGKHTYPKDLKV